MGGGLGPGLRDHRGASSRQGRRRGAKQLVRGLGRSGARVLGGQCAAAAGLGLEDLCFGWDLPAALIAYIRRNVREPEIYLALRARQAGVGERVLADSGKSRGRAQFLDIFRPPLLFTTFLATVLSTGMLAAYYSVLRLGCRRFWRPSAICR